MSEGSQSDGGAVAVLPPAQERSVVRPVDVDGAIEAMREHQRLLQGLLDPADWQGEPGAEGSFPKKSAWRKIATAYCLDLKRVEVEVTRDQRGAIQRVSDTWRASQPGSGRAMESSGHCSIDESRFTGAKGRQKAEHDVRATAETRAKNRAISDLVGMGQVSAEEVDGDPEPYGPAIVASRELQYPAKQAVAKIIGDPQVAAQAWKAICERCGGYFPQVVADALVIANEASQAPAEQEGPVHPPQESAAMPAG